MRIIHHQVNYRCLNTNTSIVAAILFSGHPYIGTHYRATLIISKICGSTSPPTHYEPHPHLVWPTSAKNRYLNSRLVILHASELATEPFDELQSPICMFMMSISRPQSLPNVCRITWFHHQVKYQRLLVRNKTKWRLTCGWGIS